MAEEFSYVSLTTTNTATSYRTVRTNTGFCLCSMNGLDIKGYGSMPAYVVLTAPKEAANVNLSIRDLGTFSDVAVAPSMPTRSVVPLGYGRQLRLLGVARITPGKLRVRFAVEAPTAGVSGTEATPSGLLLKLRQVGYYVYDGGAPWNAALTDTKISESSLFGSKLARARTLNRRVEVSAR